MIELKLLDYKIDEYKLSKIKPTIKFHYGKDNCQLYAPFSIKGVCRLCGQDVDNHKRWFEYTLKCIIIQNYWRKYKLRKRYKLFLRLLGNILCEDIQFYLLEKYLLKQNGVKCKKILGF